VIEDDTGLIDDCDMKIKELDGEVVNLSGVKEIHHGLRNLKVSQAVFIIETQSVLTRGIMFLWDDDASRVRDLVLGARYRFEAAVKTHGTEMILFFLPCQTCFKVLARTEG